jgi:protoporphyrinogen oxidase
MKIAIIGAGFTGLSAAYQLQKDGHEVTVFEKDAQPGGLAIGYQEKSWDWSLEKHYHHWFTNDDFVLNLAKEIGFETLIKKPKSSFYIGGKSYQFDSPMAILSFPKLRFIDRFRMAAVFAILFRFNPFWKPLENFRISKIVPKLIGTKAYRMLWEPQLVNKMGPHAQKISLVWFWARIKKRTTSLAYPSGGFLNFAQALVKTIEDKSGSIHFNTEILAIESDKKVTITIKEHDKTRKITFDSVIVTLPSFLFLKIAPTLPETYKKSLVKLEGLSATNLVLRLKKPFFQDSTYWMSICEENAPIMAIIEHTNFMDKKHYNNEHIVYLGNYAFTNDKLDWDKEDLLDVYDPFLQKINATYKENLIAYELFKAPFAQPIVPMNYSQLMPKMITPMKNVFLANIEQVYPWDRGTNYAVELGLKAASLVTTQQT